MRIIDAYIFLLLGAAMYFAPELFPGGLGCSGPDGSEAGVLWLEFMGWLNGSIGLGLIWNMQGSRLLSTEDNPTNIRSKTMKTITIRTFETPAILRAGIAACALALASILSGCLVVAAGAGAGAAIAYKMGRVETVIPASLPDAMHAADHAITRLQFVKTGGQNDALNAVFTARTALDKEVRIELAAQDENSTRVSIRVGVFGDEAMSLKILEEIKASL